MCNCRARMNSRPWHLFFQGFPGRDGVLPPGTMQKIHAASLPAERLIAKAGVNGICRLTVRRSRQSVGQQQSGQENVGLLQADLRGDQGEIPLEIAPPGRQGTEKAELALYQQGDHEGARRDRPTTFPRGSMLPAQSTAGRTAARTPMFPRNRPQGFGCQWTCRGGTS